MVNLLVAAPSSRYPQKSTQAKRKGGKKLHIKRKASAKTTATTITSTTKHLSIHYIHTHLVTGKMKPRRVVPRKQASKLLWKRDRATTRTIFMPPAAGYHHSIFDTGVNFLIIDTRSESNKTVYNNLYIWASKKTYKETFEPHIHMCILRYIIVQVDDDDVTEDYYYSLDKTLLLLSTLLAIKIHS